MIFPIHRQPEVFVPFGLQLLGVGHEFWDLGHIDLQGIDLKSPPFDFIERVVGQEKMDRLNTFRGPQGKFDIVCLSPQTPEWEEKKALFAKPHTHNEPEIRLILEGEGLFTIRDKGAQYPTFVQRGSLLVIPSDTVHSFALTDKQTITALRVFQTKDGWVPNYLN